MLPPTVLTWYLGTLAFFFGACIGSFLNVCIYRIPRDESVIHPPSHCPGCNRNIAWYDNIPLVSYIVLRGRCRGCGIRISPRYVLVELLTALILIAFWHAYGITWISTVGPDGVLTQTLSFDMRTPVYWLMAAGLILGTFVDFEHMILPDRVTIGGMILGPILSFLVPSLHEQATRTGGLFASLIGLAVGFGLLFAVVELGKLAFGRKRIALEEPEAFRIDTENDESILVIEDDREPWSELFPRDSDHWVLEAETVELEGEDLGPAHIALRLNEILVGERTLTPTEAAGLHGRITAYTYPREAMGFGDVKLLGAIGAFLGWHAVLFTIMFASLAGSVVGIALILLRNKEWQSRIPFGPYLALAALVWALWGQSWWAAYSAWLLPPVY